MNGEFKNNLDAKGRLIVPAKIKDELGEKFYITKGFEKCLLVYPLESWEAVNEIKKSLDMFNPTARKFERHFFGAAQDGEVDNQGRVQIPQALRAFAGIEKEVYTIGMGNKFEIWSKSEYEKYLDDNSDLDTLSEEFSALGIGNKL